ncbi:nitroreductase family protein [Clostridium tagluense]|uniref:nitroreductase family protein n=1 Tax=Clostridium tagluense TaxID=360422 RepID=UPI0028157D01|nr:nitroreductase family protein [Clostridium tagluense]
MQKSIKYARIAPSAINRQPWKFRVYENEIDMLLDKGIIKIDKLIESKKLDLGIALFHIAVVLNHYNKEFNISFEREVFAKLPYNSIFYNGPTLVYNNPIVYRKSFADVYVSEQLIYVNSV